MGCLFSLLCAFVGRHLSWLSSEGLLCLGVSFLGVLFSSLGYGLVGGLFCLVGLLWSCVALLGGFLLTSSSDMFRDRLHSVVGFLGEAVYYYVGSVLLIVLSCVF